MNEFILATAVISCIVGAIFSTITGYQKGKADGEKYNIGKLTSSMIISVMASIAAINFNLIGNTADAVGITGTIVTFLAFGFGTDKGLSRLDAGIQSKKI